LQKVFDGLRFLSGYLFLRIKEGKRKERGRKPKKGIKKEEETKNMKKIFIQKCFQNFENSPGGSEKLVPAEDTNSAKRRAWEN
jgi:hypothetical protein